MGKLYPFFTYKGRGGRREGSGPTSKVRGRVGRKGEGKVSPPDLKTKLHPCRRYWPMTEYYGSKCLSNRWVLK